MPVTLVNATGYQWGVETEETGINIESVSINEKPEFKEHLMARDNTKRGFAVAPIERSISIKGDRGSSTPPFAANFFTAAVIANDATILGATGTLFLDEVTEEQNRSGWRSIDAKMSSNAGIVLA